MRVVALCCAVLLAACGGAASNETEPDITTTTAAQSDPVVDTTISESDGTIVIEATAGIDEGTEYEVPLGATVRLVLVNEDDHDEFHLHGYDLLAMVDAGEEGVIEFVADTAGRFELESHETGDLILVLIVA